MFQDRLTQALARARRQGRLVSVMFVDLDGFKRINDEFGHGVGDGLLKVVATRLTECVRATDTVARLSGDEFTLILQDLERLQDIHRVAHKILELLVQPISLEGRSFVGEGQSWYRDLSLRCDRSGGLTSTCRPRHVQSQSTWGSMLSFRLRRYQSTAC